VSDGSGVGASSLPLLEIFLNLLFTRSISLISGHVPHHLCEGAAILTGNHLQINLLLQCCDEVLAKNDNPLSELPMNKRLHKSEQKVKEPRRVDQEKFMDPVWVIALLEKEKLSEIREEVFIIRELEMGQVIDEDTLSTSKRREGKARGEDLIGLEMEMKQLHNSELLFNFREERLEITKFLPIERQASLACATVIA
jgi:hypothetical protein